MKMMRRIAILLLAVAATASASDDLTMHIMESPAPVPVSSNATVVVATAKLANASADGCASMTCAAGDVCMMQAVNCITAPCNAVPTCVPRLRTGPSCITMKCAANTTCVDLPTGSVCQPIGDTSGTGASDPCATMKCGNGTVCKLETVVCKKEPCPPVASCVAPSNSTSDPCAAVKCGNGTVCKLQTVNCLLPPCPPLPQCVSPSTGPSCMTMKCTANTTCVDLPTGSICQPNGTNSTVDPCSTIKCGNGTICKLQTVNCLLPPCPPLPQCVSPSTGLSCMTMKCTANTTCVDLPTGSICQPNGSNSTVDPCSTIKCGNGTICKLETVNCLLPPCPPLPQCVTPSTGPSCMTMKCSANTTCVDLPTGSICQPNGSNNTVDPCSTIKCGNGTICKLQTVNCLLPPCPPLPQCVSPSTGPSCMTMKCTANTTCVDLPTGSICQPNGSNSTVDPCSTVKCDNGTICKLQTVNCLLPPCPPLPQCVSPSTVSNNTVDPCSTVKCGNGTICKLQTVNCLLPPCPPLPQCVSPSTGPSCMTMKCTANTTCVDLPTGSICQPNDVDNSTNPCASMLCPIGSVCQLRTKNCTRGEAMNAPCPEVGVCVPRSTNTSECLHIKCSAGFECRNGDKGETCYPISTPKPDACANHTCPAGQSCSVVVVNCLIAPCPPPRAVCGPRRDNPCNTAECAKGYFCVAQGGEAKCLKASGASCAATSCPVNTKCIDYKEGAVCMEPRPKSNLTCATVKCGGNTTCVILRSGPSCVPLNVENPCNAMECNKGFICIVQQGEGTCVRLSGATCAATSCPVKTTCIEFKQGATCLEGSIGGGCANMTCGGGSRCKETIEGPKCISGGKRDHRVVDMFGCGGGEQHTMCMPRCEDTCRGIQMCDPSIPEPTNGTIWTPQSIGNSSIVPSHCVEGCICRPGFKRNVQGNCVPANRCWLTPGCRDNESWSRCIGCEATCDNPILPEVCAAECRSGCACDEGYVRTKRGMCVMAEDCSAIDLINGDHGNHTIAIEG